MFLITWNHFFSYLKLLIVFKQLIVARQGRNTICYTLNFIHIRQSIRMELRCIALLRRYENE